MLYTFGLALVRSLLVVCLAVSWHGPCYTWICPAMTPGGKVRNTKTMKKQNGTSEKPFRGEKVGVYWHRGGWYCAGYCADGVTHYQQTGTQTLAEANAEAKAAESGQYGDCDE